MGRYSYKNAMDELVLYATGNGYIVNYTDCVSNIYWYRDSLNFPKSITIDGSYTWEMRVYTMLHELGHHELRKDWDSFNRRFGVLAKAEEMKLYYKDNRYMRRDSYMVDSLAEEYAAWDMGLCLANELGIRVNMSKWDTYRVKCLKTYMLHFVNSWK